MNRRHFIKAPEKISNLDVSQVASSQPYQLTVKRGFLALFIMYACQTLVGLGFAYGIKFIQGTGDGAGTIDIQMIGMTSVLLGGAITLLWVGLIYADLVRLFYLKLDYSKALLKRISL